MKNLTLKGYFYAAGSAISFGLIPLFVIPLKNESISMDLILFYRFLVAAVLIFFYCIPKRISLKISQSDLPKLIFMGLLYALSAEFLFWGYDAMSPGIASTVLYIYPIIVALILAVGFGEKISVLTGVSILIALCGVMFMSWEGESMQFNWVGTLIVLGSSIFYATYMVVVNKANLKASGLTVTFYSVLFSSLYYAIKLGITQQSFELPSYSSFAIIVAFSIVTVVISVLFIVLAIQIIGSTPTAILGALEPAVAVWISVFFFDEKATWNLFLGLFFILAALTVNIYGERKNLKNEKGEL